MQDITTLTETLKTSSLNNLLEQVLSQVKASPDDLKAREVLFKLYCVDGAWDSALLQLQTLSLLDEEMKKQCELYKNLVFSEMQRTQVLSGERLAATLQGICRSGWRNYTRPTDNIARAIWRYRISRDLKPLNLLRKAVVKVIPRANLRIADSDGRLGPVCEFICAGGYRWLPFSEVQQLRISKPKDLIDLLWTQASVNVAGEEYFGFIPARYPIMADDGGTISWGQRQSGRCCPICSFSAMAVRY